MHAPFNPLRISRSCLLGLMSLSLTSFGVATVIHPIASASATLFLFPPPLPPIAC